MDDLLQPQSLGLPQPMQEGAGDSECLWSGAMQAALPSVVERSRCSLPLLVQTYLLTSTTVQILTPEVLSSGSNSGGSDEDDAYEEAMRCLGEAKASGARPAPAAATRRAHAKAPSADATHDAAAGAGVRCGLGITLRLNPEGQYYVKRMERGGPAERSGQVNEGDKLLAVGGLAVSGFEYQDLANLVLGPEGSSVTLALGSADGGGHVREVTLCACVSIERERERDR